MYKSSLFLSAALVGFVAFSAEASAQSARRSYPSHSRAGHVYHPYVVHGRSFLDSGNVVPAGSGRSYVAAETRYNRLTPDTFNPSLDHTTVLSSPLAPDQTPLFKFSGPAF